MKILAVVLTMVSGAVAFAQERSAPYMSATVFDVPVSFDECRDRVSRALAGELYGNLRSYGNGWLGFTASHSVAVHCTHRLATASVVSVVVASASDNTEQRDRLVRLISAGSGAAGATGCGWRDGQDPGIANDPGRGVADWQVHFRHVNDGPGFSNVHELVANRLSSLRGCLSRDSYARAYASTSVAIAAVGRREAGWVDGMDSRAGADLGRGVSDWSVHYQHVASGRGEATAPAAVAQRLDVLRTAVPRETYARLYADVSVRIAQCGVQGDCGSR